MIMLAVCILLSGCSLHKKPKPKIDAISTAEIGHVFPGTGFTLGKCRDGSDPYGPPLPADVEIPWIIFAVVSPSLPPCGFWAYEPGRRAIPAPYWRDYSQPGGPWVKTGGNMLADWTFVPLAWEDPALTLHIKEP